jgi:beta-lactamase regulating signal transducer with metallopeptidase domain
LRPALLLPAGAEDWPDQRLRVVLHHELAHVQRNDWMIQIIAELVRAAYWFNPICWMTIRRLVRESEHACDDMALNCGISGNDYAEQLLAVALPVERATHHRLAALSVRGANARKQVCGNPEFQNQSSHCHAVTRL